MKIGIIGAMKEEVQYFKESINEQKSKKIGSFTFFSGVWEEHEVVITQCGVGKVNAAMTTQILIDIFQSEKIIFTGVAGEILESLNVGDIVISTICQEHDIDASPLGFKRGTIPMHDGPSAFKADPELVDKAYEASMETVNKGIQVIKGKIVSGDQFIANREDVKELSELFDAACVEMEGAAVAHVASFNQVPFVVVRAISDKANGEAADSFESFVEEVAKLSAEIIGNLIKKI
ncbi:5'-methylthioadenosine/adenosylhomocysteine nucleosidase [Evansella cellulosilytica]|uniref:adenosylhomocysteine nucleosidase n=1 Tax=Evansella cellulosilytica (strain ATCC 21833 / DSM 2522 / FERM P-1141 / JCM 9156 / N-4) TaxID=649639 RepID=E6U166_EVAC2|nr:5'-methylthioadenosine/adenosylhomocysteine nucleosidase [Evansella cellulosilytica]ADU31512.1 MTA/SAH nucleosidase [Evansella cellulosilytica DSM 2522]